MKNMAKEFRDFIARGNVIELAVAVVLGAAFKAVIDAFVNSVINPLVAAILGKPNLDDVLTITLREGEENEAVISFGAVLTQLITFVSVALVLFFVIKAYNHLRRDKDAVPAGPSEVDLLTEIRDELRRR
jgi:large conductance mechanosensitive channel